MKKHLLIFLFLLCASVAGMAQTLVNKTDSTYIHHGAQGVPPALAYTAYNTIDASCRIDTGNFRNFDENTHQLSSFTRSIYSYYPGSTSLYQTVFQQSAPSADSPFTNVSRQTFTYDAKGFADSTAFDTWDGSRWQPSFLLIDNYTPAGDPVFYLQQIWNTNRTAYVNTSRNYFLYDGDGNETYYAYQRWDTAANLWNTTDAYSFTYDTNGFQVSETDSNINSNTGMLEPYTQTTFFNNSRGYTDSSYTVEYRYFTFIKSYLTYYPNSDQYQYRYSYYYTGDSSTLVSTNLQKHFFDSSAYRIFDSTAYLTNFGTGGSFIPSLSVSSLSTANADSTIRSVGYSSTFYTSGAPYRSDISRYDLFYVPCTLSALPVTLLSFTANKKDNNAVLQWKTSNETNTAFFNVQRSTDGVHFTTIGSVKAAGNSNGERSYTYTDFNVNTLGANKLYYRLAQQDVDGTIHNSRIAQIDITNGKLSITLSPNPVRNSIGIYPPVSMPNAIIRIADMSGKVVYASRSNLSAGTTFTINAATFAKGVYFVTVQSGTDKQVLKLVKE